MPRCPLTTTPIGYPLDSRFLLPASDGYVPAPAAPSASDMWQPRQTLENNCSPLFSVNPKPALNAGSDAEWPALWAWAMHDTSKDAADIVTMKLVFRRLKFPCMIRVMTPSPLMSWLYVLTTRSCNRVIAFSDDRIAPSCHAGM